ncbi:MAG TPA: MBL fold hydrolase [Bacteroidetes bacterium]|jgi:hydroxyacylglutathione hydrolase|nr:MAG: MBL fold metallo-hydrolase [Sphingobacteriales bacterium BACL12 MAG-120802-bin5]KRP12804.1 MAG: MBL fold metallo-hydrolase [Sphingobacteriales bacterium BACL12 MAG-120813-bin55]HCK21749.1 MBL fold hydrolase [Bacteroidota bacterium]
MCSIAVFSCNPFEENTYVVYDATGECVIVDAGCYTREEQKELSDFIEKEGLQPVQLLNTHCHVDHVLGNSFVSEKWRVPLYMHKDEVSVMRAVSAYADSMGLQYQPSPQPDGFLDEGDEVVFGQTRLKVLFTPGHSPASICFYNEADNWVIGGDVLFLDSIGRYDLPGGNLQTLLRSIKTKLLPLPDSTTVYPGHGPHTTIGREKKYNPFLLHEP